MTDDTDKLGYLSHSHWGPIGGREKPAAIVLREYWMNRVGADKAAIRQDCAPGVYADPEEEAANVVALNRIDRSNGVEVVPFPEHVNEALQEVYDARRERESERLQEISSKEFDAERASAVYALFASLLACAAAGLCFFDGQLPEQLFVASMFLSMFFWGAAYGSERK